jgi:hypothetical protein
MKPNADDRQAGGLPYEHCDLLAMVITANRDGVIMDGFGSVRVRALQGRTIAIEITEDLSGMTIVAQLDWGRPKRARVDLQADAIVEAIRSASREDGLPTPFPEPH